MTDSRRRRTLLWRLGAVLISLQLMVTAALGAYAWAQIKAFHYGQVSRHLDRTSDLVVDLLAGPTPAANLDAEVARLAERAGMRVTLVRAVGTVIADSHEDPGVMDDHALRPEIVTALESGAGESIRYSRTLGERMMYVAKRHGSGDDAMVVRLAMSTTDLDAQALELARVIAVATGVFLLITTGAIYVVSRRLSSAVAQLAEGAERFASGDLRHRITAPGGRELGALARGLNEMAAQIDRTISELRQQRGEQQAIARSMSSGMMALDLGQRVISVNRAAEELLQIDGAGARGRLLLEAAREPDLAAFVAEALRLEKPRRAAFDLETASRPAVEVASEPLFDVSGERIGLLLFIDDVTRIRQLERIRSDFAANVSHELRTPITTIRGSLETLLEVGCDDPEQTARFLDGAHRNTLRLESIIEDLLALARLEQSDGRTAEGDLVSLAQIVAAAAEDCRSSAEAGEVGILVQIERDLCVRGVSRLLEQAVANLMTNAVNYSPPGTSVRVDAAPVPASSPPMVRISVRDEGPGIGPEHLPRLFERFYRVDKARSRASGGTGLGLAIVKHICLVHGGRADVESRVGEGSSFHITLPIATSEESSG